MNPKHSSLQFLVLTAFFVSIGTAAPSEPHRVFGYVNETGSGNTLDVEVSFRHQGTDVKTVQTGYDGFYDVKVSDRDYESELDIFVDGEKKGSLEFKALDVTEKNFKITTSEKNQEPPSDEENSQPTGGSGAPPVLSQNNETTDKGNENSSEKIRNSTKPNESLKTKVNNSQVVEVEKNIENVTKGQKVKVDLNQDSGSDKDNKKSGDEGRKRPRSTVSSVSFTSSSETSSAEVKVTELSEKKFEEKSEITDKPNGSVVKVIEVDTALEAENASFEFKLNDSQLESRNASPGNVVQQRYNNGSWNELRTLYEGKNDSYSFTAYSPDGFSFFAITVNNETGAGEGENKIPGALSIMVVLVSVLLFLIYWR